MKTKQAEAKKAISDGIQGGKEGQFYWKPDSVGQKIEGLLDDIEPPEEGKENFGDKYVLRVERGEEVIYVSLPAHQGIKSKMSDIFVDDYVFVEVTQVLPPSGDSQYPRIVYEVTYIRNADIPKEVLDKIDLE